MNKKIIAGIIAGAVVLIAAVVAIFYFSGTVKLNLKSGGEKGITSDTSSVNSSVESKEESNEGSSTESSAKTEENNSNTESASNSSSALQTSEERSTGNDTVKVENATVKDNKVTVPIYATKNDGLAAARIFLSFDKDVFDYADVTPGDIFDNCNGNYSNGEVVIVATTKDAIYDVTGAGVIANLILVPKPGISKGEYKVTLDKEKSEYANFDGEFVKPTIETGKIVIK